VLGVALNGTSSVLYGSVAELVSSERRARSYAIFYTLGIGASALSPFVYGAAQPTGAASGSRSPSSVASCSHAAFTLPLRADPTALEAPHSA
jgi:MFS family permease